jgi:hypothetical protein
MSVGGVAPRYARRVVPPVAPSSRGRGWDHHSRRPPRRAPRCRSHAVEPMLASGGGRRKLRCCCCVVCGCLFRVSVALVLGQLSCSRPLCPRHTFAAACSVFPHRLVCISVLHPSPQASSPSRPTGQSPLSRPLQFLLCRITSAWIPRLSRVSSFEIHLWLSALMNSPSGRLCMIMNFFSGYLSQNFALSESSSDSPALFPPSVVLHPFLGCCLLLH